MYCQRKLGLLIESLRGDLGLSKAELAEDAGVALNTVYLVEIGRRNLQENNGLEKVALAVGIPASIIKLLSDDTDDADILRLQMSALKIVRKRIKRKREEIVKRRENGERRVQHLT